MLLVDNLDRLLVLALKQERAKLDTRSFEEHVRLINTSNDKEMGDDVLTWDAEDPARLMLTDTVRGVLKDHLALFAGQDEAASR